MRRIQHPRSLQPTGPPAQPPPPAAFRHSAERVFDAIEMIRQEFDNISADMNVTRTQRDELETNVSSQVNELNIIRQSLYELEQSHAKLRQQYDEELSRLRAELQAARQAGPPTPAGPPPVPGPSSALAGPPPAGLPVQKNQNEPIDPYFQRFQRDYDRKAPENRERERERDRDRDRERERMERDRDRERDGRDPKRVKSDRARSERGGPGEDADESNDPAQLKLEYPAVGTPTKQLPPPQYANDTPPGQPVPQASSAAPDYPMQEVSGGPQEVYRKDGSDWFAEYPSQNKTLDVQLLHTLHHESVVCCVRFSMDGRYVATGCNRTAQIYETRSGAKITVLADEAAHPVGDLYIRSVCFSPDARFLATGAEDKQIRIWDLVKKKIRTIFEGHQQEIYSLDFSRDGRLIVSGSGDKTARIWDMVTKEQKVLSINEPETVDSGVTSVAISNDGRLVAAGSLDTVVRIWDVATGQLIERLNGHRDSVYSVAFTNDGTGLVSGSLDKTLKHWDISPLLRSSSRSTPLVQGNTPSGVANGKKEGGEKGSVCTKDFAGHKDYVLSVAVSRDSKWVVSGSKDRCVQFWDARTAQMQLMLQGHKNSVISIDLTPSSHGDLLATGSGDTQARIWAFGPP